VDGIYKDHGTDGFGHFDHGWDVVDGTDGVGGKADGNEFGFAGDFAGKVVHIEGTVFDIDIDFVDDNPQLTECQPGGDIGIVVEAGDDDFVTGTQ
jgi:hypothetical protein